MTVAPFIIGEYECLITSSTKLVDTPEYLCFSVNKYSRTFNGFDSGIHFKVFNDGCEVSAYALSQDSDDFDCEDDVAYDSLFYPTMDQNKAIELFLDWMNSVEMDDRMQIIELMNKSFLTMRSYKNNQIQELSAKGGA